MPFFVGKKLRPATFGGKMPEAILDHTLDEMRMLAKDSGFPAFRGEQLYRWAISGANWKEMANIPVALRTQMQEIFTLGGVKVFKMLCSALDRTVKYLFVLEDGNIIESVFMRYDYGNTLCVSTQVGCRMGCRFCASTLEGRIRDLTAGEMLGQVVTASRIARERGWVRTAQERPITNVVLMGSGEPLDNYDNTVRFLRLLKEKKGLGVSLRNVSLSTCGLLKPLRRFTTEGLPVTLSLSLHAPEDSLRRRIMPSAAANPLGEIIRAVKHYEKKTSRRVVFEYALMKGINDSTEQAEQLARLIWGIRCHVNLIPLNPVAEWGVLGTPAQGIELFRKTLEDLGVSVTQRRSMGTDIQGACGQLRRSVLGEDVKG